MPYKRVGNKILHNKGNGWTIKQECKSVEAAKSALRFLEALEHNPNFKPRR